MNDVNGGVLQDVLDRHILRRMAGPQSFQRGEDYFASGRVRAMVEHEDVITAGVIGRHAYDVKLWAEERRLEYSCTCPMGADGIFCKHCVAVGLTWLAQRTVSRPAPRRSSKPAVTMDDVRAYLAGQEKDALVDLLMRQAMEDFHLRQQLLLKASRRGPGKFDLARYRAAIIDAIDPGDFVRYNEMHDYVRGVWNSIDSVAELLKEGYAAEAIELSEHALAAVEEAVELVDDSDGLMGDILRRLQEIHLQACRKAKPDPEELARRLFQWELRREWDTFSGAARIYARVLGKKGLAEYRRLAEAQWDHVPELKPGQDDPDKYGKRLRITHIMETLARQSGDVEAIVAVLKRDLSSAYDYLQIAETYQQARKYNLALEWAERGLEAFPQRTGSKLREFLAAEYHRRRRHDEAMALVWAEFMEHTSLDQFQNLKSHADRIGQWPVWREKALDELRRQISQAKREARKGPWSWSPRADHSELVRIFIWEKDVESAWREAQQGGCSNDLWLEMADKREKDHPEDALAVYQKQIEPTLAHTNNEAYRTAVGFLRKIRELMSRLGRGDEFAGYLKSVRLVHKRKRNFIKMLDHARWA